MVEAAGDIVNTLTTLQEERGIYREVFVGRPARRDTRGTGVAARGVAR